eukprot:CAMPEP_0173158226 /NCGR_PEP_ID=MMETSP1105-20130129/16190_1 /TAXON_ID=2985 /ORGANISM="Ochromonas sp., Strain BG-1" /LENGTH=737 /DNA_ID=CAMNT_0014076033 /DNA_START=186 /DNA_END=2399 /DNA_ORIENTATION=+
MAANRKLQGEIQQVLKKIEEGVEIFDETMSKVYAAETQALKEKFEADLKKEIKKLQRLRDQVKNWIGSNEVKDKGQLTEAKKLIETKMELFKICEKDTKTKAYSKEGLAREARVDPKDAAREEKRQWLNDCIEQLQDFINTVEAEKEKAANIKVKGKNKENNLEKFDNRIQKHKWHMAKIELIMRLLDSEELDPSSLDNIKDSLEYYIETAAEDDGALGVEHEFDIYEDLDLDSFTSNSFEISPRPAQTETPSISAEQPDDKSPQPLTLPEKETGHEKSQEKSQEKSEKKDHPEPAHPKTGSHTTTPVTTAQQPPSKAAPKTATTNNAHHEKEKTASVTSPPVTAASVVKNHTANHTNDAHAHHSSGPNSQHPAASAAGHTTSTETSPVPIPAKPTITAAQIVSQNLPQQPPAHTTAHPAPSVAPVQQQSTPIAQPASLTPPAPTIAQIVAQTVTTPVPAPATVPAPASLGHTPAANAGASALADDLEKLQIGRAQPGLVQNKITSPQAPPLQTPSQLQQQQMKSPVKVPPTVGGFGVAPGGIGGLSDLGVNREAPKPDGLSLSGIIGGPTPSGLLPSPAAPAVANPPPLTAEMLNTIMMLKQSATFLPEPEQDKTSTYAPRNAYNTHPLFPTTPLFSNQESTQLFDKLSWDTFFFAFYFQQGSYQQYLAAKKLKKGSWRFHRKYTTWFQRHNEPKITTKDYEEGTYLYFDFESGWCNRIKTEFKFEYAFLEDEVNI